MEARWTKKHSKSFYGYKLHANTDRRCGFIRQHEVTPANVHDSKHFESILDPVIQHKGHATKPLSEAQQRRNHRIAKDRAFGEHPFARLAQQGGKCLRTIGLKVASHNLMRLSRLKHRGVVPA